MPLSAPNNLLNTGNYVSAGSSSTTAAFTPHNNSVLIVFIGVKGTGISSGLLASNISLTSTPSLTFTSVLNVRDAVTNAGAPIIGLVYRANITTAVSTTLTVNNSHTADIAYQLQAIDHTGASLTPIGATATGTDETLGAVSITLGATPASTSYIYGAAYRIPGGFNPGWTVGSGWTQLYQDGYTPDGNISGGVEYRTGTTSTSVSWTDITTSTSTQNQVELGIEVVQAGAVTSSLPIFKKPLIFFNRRI